jgi:hypothetical protein
MKPQHEQIEIEIGDKMVPVDVGIVSLVRALNGLPGVVTEDSCQGSSIGLAMVHFSVLDAQGSEADDVSVCRVLRDIADTLEVGELEASVTMDFTRGYPPGRIACYPKDIVEVAKAIERLAAEKRSPLR